MIKKAINGASACLMVCSYTMGYVELRIVFEFNKACLYTDIRVWQLHVHHIVFKQVLTTRAGGGYEGYIGGKSPKGKIPSSLLH